MKKLLSSLYVFVTFIVNAQSPDLKQVTAYQSDDMDIGFSRFETQSNNHKISYLDDGNRVVVLDIKEDKYEKIYTSKVTSCSTSESTVNYLFNDSLLVFGVGEDLITENYFTGKVTYFTKVLKAEDAPYLKPLKNNRFVVVYYIYAKTNHIQVFDITNGRKILDNDVYITMQTQDYIYYFWNKNAYRTNLNSLETNIVVTNVSNSLYWISGEQDYTIFNAVNSSGENSKLICTNKYDQVYEKDLEKEILKNGVVIDSLLFAETYFWDTVTWNEKYRLSIINTITSHVLLDSLSNKDLFDYRMQSLGTDNKYTYLYSNSKFLSFDKTTSKFNVIDSLNESYQQFTKSKNGIIIYDNSSNKIWYLNLATKKKIVLNEKHPWDFSYNLFDDGERLYFFESNGIFQTLKSIFKDSMYSHYDIIKNEYVGLASRELMKSDHYIFTISNQRIFVYDSLETSGVRYATLPHKISYESFNNGLTLIKGDVFYYVSQWNTPDSNNIRYTLMACDLKTLAFENILDDIPYSAYPNESYKFDFNENAIKIDSFLYFPSYDNTDFLKYKIPGSLFSCTIQSADSIANLFLFDYTKQDQGIVWLSKKLTPNAAFEFVDEKVGQYSINDFFKQYEVFFIKSKNEYFFDYYGSIKKVNNSIANIELEKYTLEVASDSLWVFVRKNEYFIYDLTQNSNTITPTLRFKGKFDEVTFNQDLYLKGDKIIFNINNDSIFGVIDIKDNKVKSIKFDHAFIFNLSNEYIYIYNVGKNTLEKYDFNMELQVSKDINPAYKLVNYNYLFPEKTENLVNDNKYQIITYHQFNYRLPLVLNTEDLSIQPLIYCQNNRHFYNFDYYAQKDDKTYFIFHNEEQSAQIYTLYNPIISNTTNPISQISDLHLHPNPTSSYLMIDLPIGYINGEVKIYSLDGREMQCPINNNQIDIQGLNNGMHFIEIQKDKKVLRGKFVVCK